MTEGRALRRLTLVLGDGGMDQGTSGGGKGDSDSGLDMGWIRKREV